MACSGIYNGLTLAVRGAVCANPLATLVLGWRSLSVVGDRCVVVFHTAARTTFLIDASVLAGVLTWFQCHIHSIVDRGKAPTCQNNVCCRISFKVCFPDPINLTRPKDPKQNLLLALAGRYSYILVGYSVRDRPGVDCHKLQLVFNLR